MGSNVLELFSAELPIEDNNNNSYPSDAEAFASSITLENWPIVEKIMANHLNLLYYYQYSVPFSRCEFKVFMQECLRARDELMGRSK